MVVWVWRVSLTAVDSLEARVISRFPLSPTRAGTKMNTSVICWNTSQCWSHTHTHTRIHTHARTHARTHACTHTHTHTLTKTNKLLDLLNVLGNQAFAMRSHSWSCFYEGLISAPPCHWEPGAADKGNSSQQRALAVLSCLTQNRNSSTGQITSQLRPLVCVVKAMHLFQYCRHMARWVNQRKER